ncbi:S26 family signal peptidase [Novosphingobium malaysiense]|uniref:Peptidase S26 domain-containing protein n=1 Tax=Novosphingobium malaysiense TaxID=1348853 RepID=A0A0B1ZIB9_9SPHN|nr:S26 family signal peptidase [Novosphingobium malaysiense]KHK89067.1 hypothetical protein LK12_22230 [Novosphingobium malaysiense]
MNRTSRAPADAAHARGGRRGPARTALAAGVASGLLGATMAVPFAPLLVWNASDSAPVGLYAVAPGMAVHRGDYAIAWLPERFRRLAARRRYLPFEVPLVKKVAAEKGARVCASGNRITVKGSPVALRRGRDLRGRLLPRWKGCLVLARGEVFLLSRNPRSFDSRYFGPVAGKRVVGRAWPLWTR